MTIHTTRSYEGALATLPHGSEVEVGTEVEAADEIGVVLPLHALSTSNDASTAAVRTAFTIRW